MRGFVELWLMKYCVQLLVKEFEIVWVVEEFPELWLVRVGHGTVDIERVCITFENLLGYG